MNIRDAKQEIIHTIRTYTAKNEWGAYAIPALRQRPLLLIGPPGIGKTAVMEQAASECGVGFVSYTMTHHTRQSAIGLPFIERRIFDGREYAVTEYTMSEIIASVFSCIEESGCREGLLFLDEINCVSETLAPAMLQFLQTKTFGNHRLPDGWILAAAGNPPEYNKSVREFDIATLDRLKYIEVEADYDAWRPYALEMNIHGAILSYLDTHRDSFYLLKQSYSNRSFATARGWEDLSCLLLQYEAQDFPVTPALIAQYLHSEDLAQDFAGYYHLFLSRKKTIPVPAMMDGEETAAASCSGILSGNEFDAKLHLVHLMLSCFGGMLQKWDADQEQLNRLSGLFDRLERYRKQQHIEKRLTAIPDFLKKEQEILTVRKEHGLSSEQELQKMQHSLYELRSLGYEYRAAISENSPHMSSSYPENEKDSGTVPDLPCESILLERRNSQESEATFLTQKLERCIALLAASDGAEFTVFLSSLSQNPLFASFLRRYPSELYERYQKKLDFTTRESELKKKLLQQ